MGRRLRRSPLLAAALLTMVWSAWLGLARLGWAVPVPSADHVLLHGPLFFNGFFGTLIALERAVALGARWAYAGPILSVAGAALLVSGQAWPAALATTTASGVLLTGSAAILVRQPSLFGLTMAAGAAAWLGGNVQWLAGAPVYRVVYWWMGFLVLTIAGERLELNRLLRPTTAVRAWFVLSIVVLAAGMIATSIAPGAGVRVTGTGLAVLTAWLLRHDIARRTVRQHGLTRFMAICLLAGYVWLGAGGLMAIWFGAVPAGPSYDAVLHAVLLGFVMSMVFAHAPIIFPAILGVPLPYRPAFYAHVILLHASLAVRMAGDLVPGFDPLRAWGGLLNAAALLLFVGNTVRSALLAARAR
jgi:hypothetical protein